ncbi:UNVERIFIED_CONTAM: hypothetical protein Sradi_4235200 [Sesamum radiatum]|uniref:Uncharacterized protein n=1 Tax=Sesamum radiatum TaxID=300843 RepID=A0AAW2P6M7_SESRA
MSYFPKGHHDTGDEVDDFDEYDPTPYGRGYDIALTYGRPLPHSEETCYPNTSSASDDFDYDRPQYTSYADPSAYADDALDNEYKSGPAPGPDLASLAQVVGTVERVNMDLVVDPSMAGGLSMEGPSPSMDLGMAGSRSMRDPVRNTDPSMGGSPNTNSPVRSMDPVMVGNPSTRGPSQSTDPGMGGSPNMRDPALSTGRGMVARVSTRNLLRSTAPATGGGPSLKVDPNTDQVMDGSPESEAGGRKESEEFGSGGYGRKSGYGEEESGGGYGYGRRTEYEEEKPSYGRPTYETEGYERPSYGRSEEEDYRKPSYERRDDDDSGYGRKKYVRFSVPFLFITMILVLYGYLLLLVKGRCLSLQTLIGTAMSLFSNTGDDDDDDDDDEKRRSKHHHHHHRKHYDD